MNLFKRYTFILIFGGWGLNAQAAIKPMALPSANPETYGIWSEEKSKLGHEIWKNSNRTTVEELYSTPWPSFSSPTLHRLALRLLLASTEVPAPKDSPVNLLELRAQRLYDLGEVTHAFDLIKGFSTRMDSVLFHKVKFSTLITQGKYAEALSVAMDQMPKNNDVFWQEAIIFCQLLIPAQKEAARLSLALYKDSPKIADSEFFLLAENILGNTSEDIPVSSTHSLMKLLLRVEAKLLPDPLLGMMPPGYLVLIQRQPGFAALPLATRMRIQERIALFSVDGDGPKLLEKIYGESILQASCPFDATQDPFGNDPVLQENDPLVRAYLFHFLSTSITMEQKIAYGSVLLKNALHHNLIVPISHLLQCALKDLKVKDCAANPYLLLAHSLTHTRSNLSPDALGLEDPVLLTILLLQYPKDGWDAYWRAHPDILQTALHKYVLLSMIYPWHKALSHSLSLTLWKHQADFEPETYKAPFLLNLLLEDAQNRKQKGEAVILALLLSVYEDNNIRSLPLVLNALDRVGLSREALDLAMEKLTPLLSMPALALPNKSLPVQDHVL